MSKTMLDIEVGNSLLEFEVIYDFIPPTRMDSEELTIKQLTWEHIDCSHLLQIPDILEHVEELLLGYIKS